MLATPERDDRTQHPKPKEAKRGRFLGPDQGTIENVASRHAPDEHDDVDGEERDRNPPPVRRE